MHDSKLVDIALECGYQNQETFIRAFRRRFSMAPSAYRDWVQSRSLSANGETSADLSDHNPAFEISTTNVVQMRPVQVAFIRHVGPYENVPESLFDELVAWSHQRSILGPAVWMGIGHDSPGTTAPALLRFDAARVVAQPFVSTGRIGCQQIPGGSYAVTTHVGPYSTLPEAYGAVFARAMALKGFRLIGLPTVEVYHTARVSVGMALNHTDICLAVERV